MSAEIMKRLEIDQLSVEQRLTLIDEIWKSIDAETVHAAQLTDAQLAEFEMRMLDDDIEDDDLDQLAALCDPPGSLRGTH
jgi:putative addiction module component (TIGR02574 family)